MIPSSPKTPPGLLRPRTWRPCSPSIQASVSPSTRTNMESGLSPTRQIWSPARNVARADFRAMRPSVPRSSAANTYSTASSSAMTTMESARAPRPMPARVSSTRCDGVSIRAERSAAMLLAPAASMRARAEIARAATLGSGSAVRPRKTSSAGCAASMTSRYDHNTGSTVISWKASRISGGISRIASATGASTSLPSKT